MHIDLQDHETEIRGSWITDGDRVVADAACSRIDWLTNSRLDRIATDESGWKTVYCDPRNGRLWELSYPKSGFHGGGPPVLRAFATADQIMNADNE